MSDFVDRLERELLAAGRRSRPRSLARRLAANTLPLVASVAVTALVVVVIVTAGFIHGNANTPTGAAHHRAGAPPTNTLGLSARACAVKRERNDFVLAPLIKTAAAPSQALLSQAAFLRRPAGLEDRFDLRFLDRWPDEVVAVYVRYIRVISGPHNARVAIMPALICSRNGALENHRPPIESLMMVALSTPPHFPRVTSLLGTAADIRNGTARAFSGTSLPLLWVSVVPDGVAKVVLRIPGHHRAVVSITIHDNVGIARPVPGYAPASITWYAPDGKPVRTFHPPY